MANDHDTLDDLISSHLPQLVHLMDQSTLSEINLTLGSLHLTLKRSSVASPLPMHTSYAPQATTPPYYPVAPAAMPSPGALTDPLEETLPDGTPVTAPMVGTFYLSATPGGEPFVHEGDVVEKGQTVGIIEAMKVMNEIDAEVSGRIVRLLVQNQQPVEYGQRLMIIGPE